MHNIFIKKNFSFFIFILKFLSLFWFVNFFLLLANETVFQFNCWEGKKNEPPSYRICNVYFKKINETRNTRYTLCIDTIFYLQNNVNRHNTKKNIGHCYFFCSVLNFMMITFFAYGACNVRTNLKRNMCTLCQKLE